MTAFPSPLSAARDDVWQQTDAAVRSAATTRAEAAATAADLIALLTDDDVVVRIAAARLLQDRLSDLGEDHTPAVLDVFENDDTEGVWVALADAIGGGVATFGAKGLMRLKAVSVLDASDRKRAAALEQLARQVDNSGSAPPWIVDFVTERIMSDDSNFVRATAATRVVTQSDMEATITEFATQWLLHTGIEPPGVSSDEWAARTKQEDFFATELRELKAHERGVRTLRSRSTEPGHDESDGTSRRGGPTLVQGHDNTAGALVNIQRGLAVLLAAGGIWMMVQATDGPMLGIALLVAAVLWLAGLQVWKWYRYG